MTTIGTCDGVNLSVTTSAAHVLVDGKVLNSVQARELAVAIWAGADELEGVEPETVEQPQVQPAVPEPASFEELDPDLDLLVRPAPKVTQSVRSRARSR